MPTSLKVNLNGWSAIKKIGINNALYDEAQKAEVSVVLTAKQLIVAAKDGSVQCSVEMTLDNLHKLNSGTIPTHVKTALSSQITSAIKKVLTTKVTMEQLSTVHDAVIVKPVEGQSLGDLLAAALDGPPIKPVKVTQGKPLLMMKPEAIFEVSPGPSPSESLVVKLKNPTQTKMWEAFPITEIHHAKAVALSAADRLYQPVIGTSPGSRYFVIAGREDLAVAARWKGSSLSIRVEGNAIGAYKSNVINAGIDWKDKNYASLHLEIDNQVLANKAIGAILMGLQVEWQSPMPNINLIRET